MRIKIAFVGGVILVLLGVGLWFSKHQNHSSNEWSVGYWIWGEWSGDDYQRSAPNPPVDLIAFDMGELGQPTYGARRTENPSFYRFRSIEPANLPAARRYAAVVRINIAPFSKPDAVTPVLKRYKRLQYRFQESHRTFNEIQIDFDCPTASLSQYADWLKQWRRQLPNGTRLTITALLDWFNPGTDIGKVLSNVDSFIPQFYDVDTEDYRKMPKIAHPPDHLRWGRLFEQFKVPYQIGLSSFGRVQFAEKTWYFSHETPLNLLSQLSGEPHVYVNSSGERVFEMNLRKEFGYDQLNPDSPAKSIMIQPTGESILHGFQEARSMGPHCAGVLFFRWPSSTESLALKPNEITDILSGKAPDDKYSLESLDAECALVDCRDLSLVQTNRFPNHARTIAIESSVPLEYFLPDRILKPSMINAREVQFQIPPYNAAAKIYLGRAVSKQSANYTLRVIP